MLQDIDRYISRQDSPQKEIIQRLREIILATFPGIKEEMKLGVPWYEGRYYLVGLKTHVNLGFSMKGLTNDELKRFSGSGATMKHVKIHTVADINEKQIVELLMVIEKARKRS